MARQLDPEPPPAEDESLFVWQPDADNKPQAAAYYSEADIIGFGGAAGGGKSDLGLGMAMTRHRRSRIFRRQYTDLKGLIERGDEIQAGRCRFVWSPHKSWRTPEGRVIELAATEQEEDKEKFKGRPADLVVIDEATDFTESIFRYVTGWVRTTIEGQRTCVLLTFNPPTDAQGEWVVDYFGPWLDSNHPDPAEDGELRWYARIDDKDVSVESSEPFFIDGIEYTPESRTFFHSRVEDNRYYMATDYVKKLNNLPEPLRSQMRFGKFNVKAKDHAWQCIPTQWVIDAQARWQNTPKPETKCESVGVDVARGGSARTVIERLYGTWFDEPVVYPGSETPDGDSVAEYVIEANPDFANVYIDVGGPGGSPYDVLKKDDRITVEAVNNGSKAYGTDKSGTYTFQNIRAQAYWSLREALDPENGLNICLPPIRELRIELCAGHWKRAGGRIAIEPKEDIIKRTGKSPDLADAFALAWWGAHYGGQDVEVIDAPDWFSNYRG